MLTLEAHVDFLFKCFIDQIKTNGNLHPANNYLIFILQTQTTTSNRNSLRRSLHHDFPHVHIAAGPDPETDLPVHAVPLSHD